MTFPWFFLSKTRLGFYPIRPKVYTVELGPRLISNMVSEPGPIGCGPPSPTAARVGLDVLLPHVRGSVGSTTLLGY